MAVEHLADGGVGAAMTELEEFALDPAIASPRILSGQTEDQFVELPPGNGPPPRSSAS